MRSFLDAILAFIGSESLTDEEFEAVDLTTQSYTVETYNALNALLLTREGVSGQAERLEFYFFARGVDISTGNEANPPTSHILVGEAL